MKASTGIIVAWVLVLTSALASEATSLLSGSRPNILVLVVDDWGWANSGWHRPATFNETPTPNMHELVREGIQLDRHYVYKFCSPTRSAVLSGRAPYKVNVNNLDPSFVNPDDKVSGYAGIPINMTTMGEKMKMAGYSTHAAGKWDVGMATPAHCPRGRGFDTALIYFHHSEDPWIQLEGSCPGKPTDGTAVRAPAANVRDFWRLHPADELGQPAFEDVSPMRCKAQGPSLPYPANESGCTFDDDMLGDFMVKQINDMAAKPKAEQKPLFLYYAMRAVHGLQEAPKVWFDKFSFIPDVNRRKYAAMLAFADFKLGEVVRTLKETGMWNNTFVWATADNGGAYGSGNNYPLKGGKFSNWEGGIRVNSFASGPVIPSEMRGTISDSLTTGWDIYSTVCELAGISDDDPKAKAAGLPAPTSISQIPLFTKGTAARSEVAISGTCLECGDYHGLKSNATVQGLIMEGASRLGEAGAPLWKLLYGLHDVAGWVGPEFPNETGTSPATNLQDCGEPPEGGCLYELRADPNEHHNVIDANRDVAASMLKRIQQLNATAFRPDRGASDPAACETVQTHWKRPSGNFWGPFIGIPK